MRRRLTSVSCLGEDERLLKWKCLPGGAWLFDSINTKVLIGSILGDEIGVFVAASPPDAQQVTPTSSQLLSESTVILMNGFVMFVWLKTLSFVLPSS